MKVFIVMYTEVEDGFDYRFNEPNTYVDQVYLDQIKAETRVKELRNMCYNAWASDMEVVE